MFRKTDGFYGKRQPSPEDTKVVFGLSQDSKQEDGSTDDKRHERCLCCIGIRVSRLECDMPKLTYYLPSGTLLSIPIIFLTKHFVFFFIYPREIPILNPSFHLQTATSYYLIAI